MDIDSMINACSHIEKEDGNYIGNSFKMLRAQIMIVCQRIFRRHSNCTLIAAIIIMIHMFIFVKRR